MHKIFVYGSLKSGQGNNRLLAGRASLLGDFSTVNEFVLRDAGVPFMSVPRNSEVSFAGRVIGEVWLCNDIVLEDLDQLEGHPYVYCRSDILVRSLDGRYPFLRVQAYLDVDPSEDFGMRVIPKDDKGFVTWTGYTFDRLYPGMYL